MRTESALGGLANVRAEEDWLASLDHLDDSVLQVVDLGVDI
jgi:hypothetical protein